MLTTERKHELETDYLKWFALAVAFVVSLPAVYALIHAPSGSSYLGFEYNSDDHMVYAAWMRQAMDGHFLFDNRFATEQQPGLTVHIYFFLLGLLAKITGIPIAANLARVAFSVVFVWLLYRLVERLKLTVFGAKLALSLVVLGGGIGFLLWQNFGNALTRPAPEFVSRLLKGGLPTDVWQPEGFVFPSMLTNGLFMVSLCLILLTFQSFLDASKDGKSLMVGFLSIACLMNVHSYDVLTVALVMVGFLAATIVTKQFQWPWLGRCLLIGSGAVLPALWFVHVLQSDMVFQARAATETFSPNFRGVLAGYLPMMLLGGVALFCRGKGSRRRQLGAAIACLLFLGLAVAAANHDRGYFLSPPIWVAVFVAAIASTALLADEDPAWNLIVSWALVGTVAIYFPGLFQRKLTMGLSIPWALMGAYGIDKLLSSVDRGSRNYLVIFAIIVVGGSSIRWLFRDVQYVNQNVSNTTRHPVYLSPDVQRVIAYLNAQPGKNVLLAIPGVGNQSLDQNSKPIPDMYDSPLIPDWAPIITGFSGVYGYAGHWSETPNYNKKAGQMYAFFLNQPFLSVSHTMTPDERKAFVQETGATYALLPLELPNWPLVPATDLGDPVFTGTQLQLIKLRR